MTFEFSNYQKAIFSDVQSGKNHSIIEALAGSAKTTSLIESLNYVEPGLTWLLVAFNKNIAEELKQRAPISSYGTICTLHALGLKFISNTYKDISVDNYKMQHILAKMLGDKKETFELRKEIGNAVNLSKYCLAHTADEIDDILDRFDVDMINFDREKFINHVLIAMDISKRKNNVVDFADMIWYPNVLPIKIKTFDRVFIDEFQDMNRSQVNFVLKLIKPKDGRAFVFADQNQAIYSWAGADQQSFDLFKNSLNAKSLPLSITYRCPLAVVKEAQKFVPHLEAAPNAKEGKVETITYDEMFKLAKPGCFILSRLNAPLITLALSFIKRGVPCNIQGRDIGENLIGIVKKSKAKNLDKFLNYVDKWHAKECKRLINKNRDTTLINDKVDCLRALAEGCVSLQQFKDNLNRLFVDTDDTQRVILSSIHKSKGRERDVVFILKNTLRSFNQEELNLQYVALTRSRSTLYLVESKSVIKRTKIQKENI